MTRLAACTGPLPDQPCHPGHDPALWPVWATTAALAAWLLWLAFKPTRKDPR